MSSLESGIAVVDLADDVATKTTLLDLSIDSIAIVLAHLGKRPRLSDLARVAAVCTTLHAILADESVWLTLCKYAWSISDLDVSSDWPKLSSFHSLYAVLETWGPRQGFHHLLEVYPWGALFLLRFRGGRFVGELLHHAPSTGGDKCEAQEPVVILEVDFEASDLSDGEEGSLPAWLSARAPRMRWCGEKVVVCTTRVGAPAVSVPSHIIPGGDYYDFDDSLVPGREVHCRQYLQVKLAAADAGNDRESGEEEAEEAEGAREEDDDGGEKKRKADALSQIPNMRRLWGIMRRRGEPDEGARWFERLQQSPGCRNCRNCRNCRTTVGPLSDHCRK